MSQRRYSDTELEGQPPRIPMRIMRILDKIHVPRDLEHFVPILYTAGAIVNSERMPKYQKIAILSEVLEYIPELSPLQNIFDVSATHVMDIIYERDRTCRQCL